MRCITYVSDSKEEFFMTQTKKLSTSNLVLGAILTALVFILQMYFSFVKLGPFTINWALIPIIIGAATCGVGVGAWLGLVFGLAVLISGDAAPFLAINVGGTIVTVLVKGLLCGAVSALAYKGAYKLFANMKNGRYFAAVVAAVVCPVVNTGVFLIGCAIFFMPTIIEWAGGSGVLYYMIFGLVGVNFIAELLTAIIISPVISRLLNARRKI